MTEEEKKGIVIKVPSVNKWIISTIVLAIVCLILSIGWLMNFGNLTGRTVGILTKEQAGQRVIDYINNNLVQPGTKASLVSVEETPNFYKITTSYQGQQVPVYCTKDGKFLIPGTVIDMSQPIQRPETQQPQQEFDAPDRERPEVNLFVMSFCPYGVQAENLMKPVVDLLGTKADIRIRFIANVGGNTVDSVRSLHGINEAKEDLRQLCIMKYYDQKTFWSYLMDINQNCYPVYRDEEKLEACWKNAAAKVGIDTAKIEACAYGSEGLSLLKADEELAQKYGVRGSPTLIINGVTYGGTRSSEAFKQAICSGFITQPKECSESLSSTTVSTTTGGCR